MAGQRPTILIVGAAESAPCNRFERAPNVSTGHFRRMAGQSPTILMVGAAESAP
jgi:hypothetical protein